MSAMFALAQTNYRFYEDGTEAGSVALAAQNTSYTSDVAAGNAVILVRVMVDETGGVAGGATDDYQLQFARNGGAFANVNTVSTGVRYYDSANLTNGAATTSRLTGGTGSHLGKISEDGLVDDLAVPSGGYSELLYPVELVSADLSDADSLTFRVLRNGATFTYSVTPTITVSKTAATQNLDPSLVTNTQTFHAPTVAATYALTPALLTNTQTFHAPAISVGKEIINLTGMTVTHLGSTGYQVVKTAADGWTNAEVYSATDITGDFVLKIHHNSGGTYSTWTASVGVHSGDPTAVTTQENETYGWLIDGATCRTHRAGTRNAFADSDFPLWIGRVGDTLYWKHGSTWAGATVKDSQTGVTGVGFQLDSSFFTSGADFTLQLYDLPPALDLQPSLVTNSQTFHGPTVASVYPLTPGLTTNTQTFHAPTVTPGAVTLSPPLYTNTQSFNAHTVSASNALAPSLVTNAQTHFGPTVTTATTLSPALFTGSQSFHSPTVAPGAVTLAPPLYSNAQTFHAASIGQSGGTQTLEPGLLTNSQSFHAATASTTYALIPPLLANTQTIHEPALTASYALTAPLTTNGQAFYGPTVAQIGAQSLLPPLVANENEIMPGAVTNDRAFMRNRAARRRLSPVDGERSVIRAPRFI